MNVRLTMHAYVVLAGYCGRTTTRCRTSQIFIDTALCL